MQELIKNKKQKILVQNKKFKGRKYVDIRIYFLNKDDEYAPGKGVTIPFDKYEDFKKIISKHKITDSIVNEFIQEKKSSISKNDSIESDEFNELASDLIKKTKK